MGLLASSMANPAAAYQVAGVDIFDARPKRRGTWFSIAVVMILHVAGLYAIATWTPRSEWLRLWKPVEVKLIQEETPKPPEVVPAEEPPPPPPPKPQIVERKLESPPPVHQPRVEEKPVVPEPPAPVMTAAPSAPVVVEAPTYVVPPQSEAPPAPPRLPRYRPPRRQGPGP